MKPFRSMIKSLLVLSTAALLMLLVARLLGQSSTPSAHASPLVYTVDRTDDVIATSCTLAASDCSLRGAIIDANGNAGSTILLPAGTYVLTITQSDTDNATTGDLNITANTLISGSGASATIIQGGPGWADRIFDVAAVSLIVRGVTLQNGYTQEHGGGIRNLNGRLELIDARVLSNTSVGGGGGIYNYGGVLTLTKSAIAYNTVISQGYQGGGIYADGHARLLLTDTLVATNTADYGGGLVNFDSDVSIVNSRLSANRTINGIGGAIMNWVSAAITLSHAVLQANVSGSQGGAIFSSGPAFITDSLIVSNSASTSGGGIDNSSSMTIVNSSLTLNSAAYGGAIHQWNSANLLVSQSVIASNTASSQGGGLANESRATTLVQTRVQSNTAATQGGGLYNYNGTLTATAGVLAWNSGGTEGGAIYTSLNSQLVLSAMLITSNTATYNGGGLMLNTANAIINRSSFISNTVTYSTTAAGGAIFNHLSWLNVTRTVFMSNTAVNGGAIYNNGVSTLTLKLSQLGYNSAKYGGAVSGGGAITIDSTTLNDNVGRVRGGGLDILGNLRLINSTVSHNQAQTYGGGLYAPLYSADQIIVLQNVTIVSNTADISQTGLGYGGGIYGTGGIISMTDVLLDANYGYKGQASDCYGSLISLGYNLIQTTTGCTLLGTLTGVIINTDPLIGPLRDNGGSTWTHALLIGSPAIDAGDPGNCPATDQRGVHRPIGPRCDIGAFEAPRWMFLPIVLK